MARIANLNSWNVHTLYNVRISDGTEGGVKVTVEMASDVKKCDGLEYRAHSSKVPINKSAMKEEGIEDAHQSNTTLNYVQKDPKATDTTKINATIEHESSVGHLTDNKVFYWPIQYWNTINVLNCSKKILFR